MDTHRYARDKNEKIYSLMHVQVRGDKCNEPCPVDLQFWLDKRGPILFRSNKIAHLRVKINLMNERAF